MGFLLYTQAIDLFKMDLLYYVSNLIIYAGLAQLLERFLAMEEARS